MKRIEKFALYANRDDEGVYATYTTSEKILDDNGNIITTDTESETLYWDEARHFLLKYNLVKVDNMWVHIIKESYHSESEHELSDSEKNKYSKPQYSIEVEQRKRWKVLIVLDNWSYDRRAEKTQRDSKIYLDKVNWDISKLEWSIFYVYWHPKAKISIKK